jgi:UDP-glucose 4-epimerase
MAVLVTGGCGLAGSFAVRHAVDQGEKVVSYDIALKTELLEDILDRVVLVKEDILDAPDLMRAVKEHRIDRILHTAIFPTPGAYDRPYAPAKEQFGYVPEYSVRRGFREYIAFLKAGRWQPVQ